MAVLEMEREVQVLAVFRQILQAPLLGPEQNFFDAGGSSLLAARLATRLRTAGVLDVPTSAIFAAPTARALTSYALASPSVARPKSDAVHGQPALNTAFGTSGVDMPAAPDQNAADRSATNGGAIDRGARQRAAFARLRPAPSPDAGPDTKPNIEEVR